MRHPPHPPPLAPLAPLAPPAPPPSLPPGLPDPEAGVLARGYAVTHPSSTVVLPTAPGWAQVLHATGGVMTVHSPPGVLVVPPHRALWVPDGVPHRIVMHGRVAVRTLYLRTCFLPPAARRDAAAVRLFDVTPLARELIVHAVLHGPLLAAEQGHVRLLAVLLDQLPAHGEAAVQLPSPRDPRAAALARRFGQDPGATTALAVLAREVGAAPRTLERIFVAETGLTVRGWRTRRRMIEALRLLAEGMAVTSVAHRVGYSTPSAFAAAFRREVGRPPSTFLRPHSSRRDRGS